MGKPTTVSSHSRKGTKGVRKHTRFVPSKNQRVVPVSEVPDKVTREIQKLSDEGEKIYKQEWGLNRVHANTARELENINAFRETARFNKLKKRRNTIARKMIKLSDKRRQVDNKMYKLAEKHGILHDLIPFRERSRAKYWRL